MSGRTLPGHMNFIFIKEEGAELRYWPEVWEENYQHAAS